MRKHSLVTIFLFIIGVGLLGGLARLIYANVGPESGYKAVLLDSGDVYFAKVEGGFGHWITLRDIYYPQVPKTETGQQPQVQLIKFGNEIQGPKDIMSVNRDHVIMIQTLREDSQVISTIEKFKQRQQTQTQ